MCQCIGILENLMGAYMQESTLLREGIRASPSAKPENAKARQTTDTSGRKCLELLSRQDPLLSLLKMLLATSRWDSTKCSMTWKAKATPQGRLLFQLVPSIRRTDGIESGLWPTPKASDAIMGMTARTSGRSIERSTHLQTRVGISTGWKPGDGHVNPQFLEWLMGYPIGWTEIKHSETP